MTIIITCAVIAILIIAVLVSINIRSGSASSREHVPTANATENIEQQAAADSELKAAEPFSEGPSLDQTHLSTSAEAPATETPVTEVEDTGVHGTELQLNHTADQDFREALRRLKDRPSPAATTLPEQSDKMADDAYRRALRSFKDQPSEEE
ncbi:hypothetical protein [Paenibacillus sp. SN-8-1]|uniref:hypothetical protein n=1 Tax=Paenibacillus sp. SN-8-1 TaxID=3435409 RepID=UPI003D9A51EB